MLCSRPTGLASAECLRVVWDRLCRHTRRRRQATSETPRGQLGTCDRANGTSSHVDPRGLVQGHREDLCRAVLQQGACTGKFGGWGDERTLEVEPGFAGAGCSGMVTDPGL